MKKTYTLFALILFIFGAAQCTIQGPAQLQIGDKQIYSIAEKPANCTDCFQWAHGDQKIILEGNTQRDSLIIKGAVPGNAILSLNVKSAEGVLKCQKTIEVVAGKELYLNSEKCKIDVSSFSFVKNPEGIIVFKPAETNHAYSYDWTIFYGDGTKQTSKEINPQFKVSAQMPIVKVELIVSSVQCTRRIVANYQSYFWITY